MAAVGNFTEHRRLGSTHEVKMTRVFLIGLVDKLVAILDEMVTTGALVTVEKVRVLKYAAGQRGSSLPPPPASSRGTPGG